MPPEEPTITTQQIYDFFYVPNKSPEKNGVNLEQKSVFDLGYIPTSKAADFTLFSSGYFAVNDIGAEALNKLGLTILGGDDSPTKADGNFWQMIVTHINEEHEEAYALHNTISDNVVVFATGAKPIAVTIRGYVLIGGSDDHNYLLLRNYVDHFRARHLSARGLHLTFRSQDTRFKLVIESISLSHTIEFETYVAISISGLAYDYGQTGSSEHLDLTYYGKYRKVAASGREEEEEKEKEKKEEEENAKKKPPWRTR